MEKEYFPEVVQAIPGPGQTIYAYFSDGLITQFDVAQLIAGGGVFERLNDPEFFASALTCLNGTVAWDVSGKLDPTTCIDIDPFVVYEAKPVADPPESAIA